MNTQELRELLEKSDNKLSIFINPEVLKSYQVYFGELIQIINDFLTDEEKLQLFNYPQYDQLDSYRKCEIIKTFNSKNKVRILLENKKLIKYSIIEVIASLDSETLSQFLVQHKEFCQEHSIRPYEVTRRLDIEKAKSFIANLEHIDLTPIEKKEILATLREDVKKSVDTTNLKEEYKTAISIQTVETNGQIILDLHRNLEDYRGLDGFIRVNPERFTREQRIRFMELCDICPNAKVVNTLYDDGIIGYDSNASEYKEAEEWITTLIDSLNPEYSKAQKMAVIDNAIGKKLSYRPDYKTEVCNEDDCRALWKIISSGYGVCNGIARVEQYILERVGIESELISSGRHVFLKVKDIELPLANGEIVRGNTILDPTWNLTAHRFGGRPDNFCISYEEARKGDIDEEKKDHECHKNDEKLQDATLQLDDQSLRKLFTSVGLADKNGVFPVDDLIIKSRILHALYANHPDIDIKGQFLLLSQACPEFAKCQNSTMSILSDILLNNERLNFNKCVVNRVYSREDKAKEPVLYTYVDSNELGKRFYVVDREKGQFVELSQEEFTNQFECYDEDLKRDNRT